jgi:hypothetical protein
MPSKGVCVCLWKKQPYIYTWHDLVALARLSKDVAGTPLLVAFYNHTPPVLAAMSALQQVILHPYLSQTVR